MDHKTNTAGSSPRFGCASTSAFMGWALMLALTTACGGTGVDSVEGPEDAAPDQPSESKEQYTQELASIKASNTCGVKSDKKLWCSNSPNAAIRSSAKNAATVADRLLTTFSWFDCWGTGERHAGGNTTWYHTWGDVNNTAGWVAAVDMNTSSAFDADPSASGLRKCGGDNPGGGSTAKILPYSWQHQQTYYFCGPASTRIALTSRLSSPPSQSTLASSMGTTVNGTDHIGLVRDALNRYLGTRWFEAKTISDPPTSGQRDLLKKDVVFNIDRGYPLVANVVSGWRPPGYPGGTIYHYVAIVGYDQGGNRVLIADPAGEGSAGWSNVPRTYWVSLADLATWIGGKGYAA